MNRDVQSTENKMDDADLMICCIQGLLRYATELEATQGAQARDKVVELQILSQEIIAFWDLDGAILGAPREAV